MKVGWPKDISSCLHTESRAKSPHSRYHTGRWIIKVVSLIRLSSSEGNKMTVIQSEVEKKNIDIERYLLGALYIYISNSGENKIFGSVPPLTLFRNIDWKIALTGKKKKQQFPFSASWIWELFLSRNKVNSPFLVSYKRFVFCFAKGHSSCLRSVLIRNFRVFF